jgi:hypothetical protein
MFQVAGYAQSERKDRPGNCPCIDRTEAMWDREPPTGFSAAFDADGRSPEHSPRIRVRCLHCGRIWVE